MPNFTDTTNDVFASWRITTGEAPRMLKVTFYNVQRDPESKKGKATHVILTPWIENVGALFATEKEMMHRDAGGLWHHPKPHNPEHKMVTNRGKFAVLSVLDLSRPSYDAFKVEIV